MKTVVRTAQHVVGIIFIISGLVKANDPLGLAYKMDEFFQLWMGSLAPPATLVEEIVLSCVQFLNEHQLYVSIFMISLEVVAGVTLLLGRMRRTVLFLLFGLILFFTFLTGYAYLSGRFTNCGCFGDCLLISPLTSFTKDILLLIVIIFLIARREYIFAAHSRRIHAGIIFASLLLSILLQVYVLEYLPIVDCLPLRKGNNIAEQTRPPADAIPSVYKTRLVYENRSSHEIKDLGQDEFNHSRIWEDKNWKWKATNTKLIRKGTDVPKLQGFVLRTMNGDDMTSSVLNSRSVILYFVNPGANPCRIDQEIETASLEKGIEFFYITSCPGDFKDPLSALPLSCDGTIFKMAARANPTIYLLKKGVIMGKWPLGKKKEIIKSIDQLHHASD